MRAGRCSPETWALRDEMRALTSKHPRSAEYLFDALRSEWGAIGDRRLWRILWWLLGRSFVVRDGDKCHSDGYVLGYGLETAYDYRDRQLVEMRGKRCIDCFERLIGKRHRWCGPRCLECYNVVAYAGYRRRRDALEAAGMCVQCSERDAAKPWVRCRVCLDAKTWRERPNRRAA